jgi:hypothetical protein
MKNVLAFPPIDDTNKLSDLLSRFAWHFGHLENVKFTIPVIDGTISPGSWRPSLPEGFDPAIQPWLDSFVERIYIVTVIGSDSPARLLDHASVVMKHVQDRDWVEQALKTFKGSIYRVDPSRVRQEGSFYIQAALDLIEDKDSLVNECRNKFSRLKATLGHHKRSWVLATGPSIEGFRDQSFEDSISFACNSTILNTELMARARPKVLVFADPIFHFGVSQYAGKFREAAATALQNEDMALFVPFKYYPLLMAKMPEYGHRIIGVPFRQRPDFNLEIGTDFEVKVTSNILTLLLLPLATTLADEVFMMGCDGRPLADDGYFWGHGKSVQINDKMQNIKEVHPGFFDIDYNEYYFEHCHTLENLIEQGETEGKAFFHCGQSYIPALKQRSIPSAGMASMQSSASDSDICVLLEPDGIGASGHYVVWHNQLLHSVSRRNKPTIVVCNKGQDPCLYDGETRPEITSHSWAVSRSEFSFTSGFAEAPTYTRFRDDILSSLVSLCREHGAKVVSLFVYYGSIQILKACQEARVELGKNGIQLKVTLCLFHESVILKETQKEPRFPPNTKSILLESVAQTDDFRIFSVTHELSSHIYSRFGVKTKVLPNPIPGVGNLGMARASTAASHRPEAGVHAPAHDKFSVLFPCRLRPEKGESIVRSFIESLDRDYIASQGRYTVRGPISGFQNEHENLIIMDNDVSDEIYRRHLADSHLVVIPYLAPHFTYRTSGIIVDALYAGKPCIVLEGTWMASVVKKFRAGLCIRYYGPESLASAISVIRKNYRFFHENTESAYQKYSRFHSWDSLSECILS